MPREGILKKRVLFPPQYGIAIENLMKYLDTISEKGRKVNQSDVNILYSKLSNIEQFVMALIKRDQGYNGQKAAMIKRFNASKSLYGQIEILREWFGLINAVVDQMYFDIDGVEVYDPNSRPRKY